MGSSVPLGPRRELRAHRNPSRTNRLIVMGNCGASFSYFRFHLRRFLCLPGQPSGLCFVDLVMAEKKIERPPEKAKLIHIRKGRELCMIGKKK